MKGGAIQILWDSSHLWGVLAWHAMRCFGAPCELVSAQKIAQGSLLRKPPAVLLAPGGNARQKAHALGEAGRARIRDWVAGGGFYIGFCGGAGLALTHENGINLCPWARRIYPDRLYHLISGHIHASAQGGGLLLPVWWPGRFEPGSADGIEILAAYEGPGADLWLADLPLMEASGPIQAGWGGRIDPDLDMPKSQPIVIRGKSGEGSYLLSYAHPETPDSPAANAWFGQLLAEKGITIKNSRIFPWKTLPESSGDTIRKELAAAWRKLLDLMEIGERLGLFFRRSEWLAGWRQGAPGIAMNHLLAEMAMLALLDYGENGRECWRALRDRFAEALRAFLCEAEAFFWNFRLSQTLVAAGKAGIASLCEERERIFGHPMTGGGIAGELLAMMDALILASQEK